MEDTSEEVTWPSSCFTFCMSSAYICLNDHSEVTELQADRCGGLIQWATNALPPNFSVFTSGLLFPYRLGTAMTGTPGA
jgi:hypothetical protein